MAKNALNMNMAVKSSKIKSGVYHQQKELLISILCEFITNFRIATLNKNNLNAEDWRWKIQGGSYVPIMTDEPPVPYDILNVIRCNCKVTSKIPCGLNICSCRANGLNFFTGL